MDRGLHYQEAQEILDNMTTILLSLCVCVSRTILNSRISSWTLKGNGNIVNIYLD